MGLGLRPPPRTGCCAFEWASGEVGVVVLPALECQGTHEIRAQVCPNFGVLFLCARTGDHRQRSALIDKFPIENFAPVAQMCSPNGSPVEVETQITDNCCEQGLSQVIVGARVRAARHGIQPHSGSVLEPRGNPQRRQYNSITKTGFR